MSNTRYIHIVEADGVTDYYSSRRKAEQVHATRVRLLVQNVGYVIESVEEDNGAELYGTVTTLRRPSGALVEISVYNEPIQ